MVPPNISASQPELAAGSARAGTEECEKGSLARIEVDEPSTDPNIVDWDGPDDPESPFNWPSTIKIIHIVIVSVFTLVSNLAATMFAPGIKEMSEEFHITSPNLEAMTVSIYVLGFALGPLILAPLSELYGRLILFNLCNIGFFAFTAGCTFSTNIAMFLAFRFISGCAASGPMSIGGGTLADIIPQRQRGKAMALVILGPILGPVLGPAVGGFAGVIGIGTAVFMRETNPVILLQRKAERMRKETGNAKLLPKGAKTETPRQLLLQAIVRPAKTLIFSPIVLLLSLYAGIVYGLVFLLFTTFPSLFQGTYGFGTGTSGLAYLGLGFGMMFGLALFSILSDKLLGQKEGESAVVPEKRLIMMKWFGPITPLGCFMYGWSAYYHTHWIVPILGTFIIGFAALFVVIPTQIYLVDAFGTQAAASAIAANLLVRSPFGAFLDLAAAPLYDRLGLGWGNSVLGFIVLVFTPVPWLFYRYGEYLRTHFAVEL
ncbi:hypothetical protein FQN49_001298 [Arthroderma sp. PD_2]|nr:hypothetical protein FQN49_001298 [Arthroderma sp. PD_2]